jgi:hypothetical protein
MSLVRVFTPTTEGELLAVAAMLEARGVPHFVQGAGAGALFPGALLALESRNGRVIMVPEERAAEARALIQDFENAPPGDDNDNDETGIKT